MGKGKVFIELFLFFIILLLIGSKLKKFPQVKSGLPATVIAE